MNYKKSLLSLVTIMALSGTAVADGSATYVPLTTTTEDASWVLFGVNGFSNGVPSNAVAGPTSFSAGLTELEDTTVTDELATSGLTVGGKDLASLTALAEAGLTALKVGVNITGITYEATEPVRTMYIKVNDTSPNVKFDYKASLEGLTMEIIVNNSTTTVYNVVISQDSTWNNASVATTDVVAATGVDDMTAITSILDTDSTNNPVNPANWDKDVHADTTVASANFYRFDAITQQWKVYKNTNTGIANDFTAFEKGSAYWGRVDVGDVVVTNDADGATNLVLGTSGNTAQSQLPAAYIDDANVSKLSTGWNMLAMDDIKPYVRHAATGLILGAVAEGDILEIYDDTGVYKVTVTMVGDGAGAGTLANQDDATLINTTIESARLLGSIPKSFGVKAFRGAADGTIILISDKKFGVNETGDATDITVTTLTGANPYLDGVQTPIADLSADVTGAAVSTYVSSAYGEYAMLVNVLAQDTTVDDVADGIVAADNIAKFIIGDHVNGDHAAIAISNAADTLADAALQFATDASVNAATIVDVNFDGAVTGDMLLVAGTNPFYIRDAVYTRVFTTDTTAADNTLAFTVQGTNDALIEPALNDAPSAIATEILADATAGAATGVYASANAADNKLVAVTTALSTFDLKDIADGTVDFLTNSTETEDIAKGAIKGVFSIDELAKTPLTQYSWSYTDFYITGGTQPLEADDGVNVNIGGAVDVLVGAPFAADLTNTALRLDYFDRIVTEVNTQIKAAGLHGFASHDYTEAIDDFTGTTLTITGVDMSASYITEVDGANAAEATLIVGAGVDANAGLSSTLGNISGDLVADLKFNAVYTPNYATYGPLYTMRDSGYDVRAMLKATTDMATSDITWDGIDLTRNENEWFKQNEFNLFSVNLDSGYWVYLEPKTADTVNIGAATFTPSYTYYFDNDTDKTTTNIINGGSLKVTVTGLNDTTATAAGTTSNVYAIIAGEEIQMKSNGNDDYTADITKYSSVDFKEQASNISFSIRATNGKGEAAKLTDAVSFDYAKPDAPVVTYDAAIATFTSASADVTKFHLFDSVVPEVTTLRDTNIVTEINATTGVGAYNVCSKFDFGVVNTLRVVAADGTGSFGTANISNATEFAYASLFKNASVITHLQDGATDKSITPVLYDATCTLEATQATGSENNGVSLKTLVDTKSARIAYVTADTLTNVGFDTNLAWTSTYKLPDGTEVVQIQNVEDYANDTLLVEYEGKLYSSTFPATQAMADAGTDARFTLTEITPANTSLAPN